MGIESLDTQEYLSRTSLSDALQNPKIPNPFYPDHDWTQFTVLKDTRCSLKLRTFMRDIVTSYLGTYLSVPVLARPSRFESRRTGVPAKPTVCRHLKVRERP